jgi:hypothetical protein
VKPSDIKQIGALKPASADDENNLLGDRFLCRGGSCLFPGRTGIGKSALMMQKALHFAVGRSCFGIKPKRGRPLVSLIIQAENDDGDLAEMRDGILAGCPWEECEREAARQNVHIVTINDATGQKFADHLECAARHVMADLVWADPLLSYMGADSMNQADVTDFLRGQIQPVLSRNEFGLIFTHHETKPPRTDSRSAWSDLDHAYASSGSSELANWPRAVLNLTPVQDAPGMFRLIGAKRGPRLRWLDPNGNPTNVRYLKHATDGSICWREADEPEVTKKTAKHTREDFLAHVPDEGAIPKNTLILKASKPENRPKIGQSAARAYLDQCIHDGTLHEWGIPRPGTNKMKVISRKPKPDKPKELDEAKNQPKPEAVQA